MVLCSDEGKLDCKGPPSYFDRDNFSHVSEISSQMLAWMAGLVRDSGIRTNDMDGTILLTRLANGG